MSEILEFIIQNLDLALETKELKIIRQFHRITHVKVYQQHIYNFCGYHATYNILQMLNYLQGQKAYIYDSIMFWKYVREVQRYFKAFSKQYSLNHEPWREYEIDHGDFERSYLKPWKEQYQDIIVIQYQFQRIVNSMKERDQIANSISQFIHHTSNEPLIQAYMLGITFHWVSFIAVKSNNAVQFYLLDSKNTDYCEWNVKEILEYLENINKERVAAGRIPYKPYEVEMYQYGIQDLQQLTDLLVEFLLGNINFREHVCFQGTLMYIRPLFDMMQMNEGQFLDANVSVFDKDVILTWAAEYKHTIMSVFKEQQIVYQRSRNLLSKINDIMSHIYQQIGQQEVHNPFQQCHDIIQGCVESFKYQWSQQLKQKQINLYLQDSQKTEHISYLIDLKKVYVREFVTKQHHYYLRLQFLENIFHPQGGGQPDDIGFIRIGDKEFQIKNMYNDRQHQESYVDIEFLQSTYELLLDCRTQYTPIFQFVNPESRLLHSQLHSAGHLLVAELIKAYPGLKYVRGMHFPKESYIQISSQIKIQTNEIPSNFAFNNLNLTISQISHLQAHEALGYVPEFVEFADIVRWVKLQDEDIGYPCYGTHTTVGLKNVYINRIEVNENEYKIYYNI